MACRWRVSIDSLIRDSRSNSTATCSVAFFVPSSYIVIPLAAHHWATDLLDLRHLLLLSLLQLCFQRGNAILHLDLPYRLRLELSRGIGLTDVSEGFHEALVKNGILFGGKRHIRFLG